MRSEIPAGLAAGAVGTVALNIATYLDMTVRARPASEVPADVAEELAGKADIDLSRGEGEEAEQNRASGLGALLGFVTGLGMGAAYGIVRPRMESAPVPLAGIGLGLVTMAASDLPATALGVTDPRTWSPSSWASDVVPHVLYGLATAIAFESFRSNRH